MATRFTPTSFVRRPAAALAAVLATALLALSAPVPVLGPDAGAACVVTSGNCGD